MKTCPNCHNQVQDEAVFCPICGTGVGGSSQFIPNKPTTDFNISYGSRPVPEPVPYVDPHDHTSGFAPADIAQNKLLPMLCYLLGPLGIIMAQLSHPTSPYVDFHIRQAMRLAVVDVLVFLALILYSCFMWLIRLEILILLIGPIVIFALIFLHLSCFHLVCKGKAKDAYFIRNFRFLY